MAVAISAARARGGGYAGLSLGSETIYGRTPRQVGASPRITMAAFAQARKTVHEGGVFGARAAKGTVIKSDPERAKMHDALKEGCVPEPGPMRLWHKAAMWAKKA